MKSALQSDESYANYRLSLVKLVTDAAGRFNVPIKNQVVLDLGCYDGAISLGYLDYGAKELYGADIDGDAVETAKTRATSDLSLIHI